ncbi:hypothetical protein [Mamestra configurata nucleopolyhedrovirus A]|uniref:Maco-A 50 n=2 Tax=Mamestra configurata nucleopolyhedrovirus TaxID=207830 RepID=Q8QLI4_NPVMC|nr:hypothetical protein McnAVgp050 [Mamestra configurata nucleopolyhedrovirus A]UVZ34884.1 MIT domain-like protein [Melanchra picta nucleopolyhedrovirus]AAM09158.1 unknown [Mamestra configurata nucleopolyhedrovirus A]AAQ11069.1 hypothetical protein [Mamestra configurata nucleopolyhedrovirus A]QEE79937.1 Maco-A 50 [Mamestra configurata nucleopolyhedrovirus A]QNH90530.1 maco-A 50 [Mamestra configurata nucleopolyhedrovirus A]
MNDITEALELAAQFERLQFYDKAIECNNLATLFLNRIKQRNLNGDVLIMCDLKTLECATNRQKLNKRKDNLLLKKYILIHE